MANSITVIDYGMSNIGSVLNALHYLGSNPKVSSDPSEVAQAESLILPGVGSFRKAMSKLRQTGLDQAILDAVQAKGRKILGICLGMQLMGSSGSEDGDTPGLGLIPNPVDRFTPEEIGENKIPHIGFNKAFFNPGKNVSKLFNSLESESEFYFVHSYRVCCDDLTHIAAETIYGETFTSAIRRDHVYGVQFHPEKSREHGLIVLNNFALSSYIK